MDATLTNTKIPDVSKIDVFNGSFFKRWQERVFSAFDVMNFADYLRKEARIMTRWWLNGKKVTSFVGIPF